MIDLTKLALFVARSPEADMLLQGMNRRTNGVFFIPFKGVHLKILASAGDGWDHVSVSLPTRVPTWEEMSHVKNMFFHPDETAMQLHVPIANHVNIHPYCLHLWRPHNKLIPLPPRGMI